jgi:hypothetical protein
MPGNFRAMAGNHGPRWFFEVRNGIVGFEDDFPASPHPAASPRLIQPTARLVESRARRLENHIVRRSRPVAIPE